MMGRGIGRASFAVRGPLIPGTRRPSRFAFACTGWGRELAMPRNPQAHLWGRARMTTHSLLLLPGDGIGPEVMAEVERLVAFFNKKGKAKFETDSALVGGASIDKHGLPLTEEALAKARAADAIVFGAV